MNIRHVELSWMISHIFLRWILLLVLLFSVGVSQSQHLKMGSRWYLPWRSIDFSQEPPAIYTDSQIEGFGSRPSCITDEEGNLLFYTNGIKVWNRYHEVMPHGMKINIAFYFEPLTPVIVPHPGDGQLYFIFSSSHDFYDRDPTTFFYCIIDMSADGGKGDVVQGNTELIDFGTKYISACSHADEKSFWVVTHGRLNSFYAFKISESGIEPPVISYAGLNYNDYPMQMKISPDGTKIAIANGDMPQLFDFNALTGVVSNARDLSAEPMSVSGVEFSSNSELLYFTCIRSIIQYDVSLASTEAIRESFLDVGDWYIGSLVDLQLAYNGKIYASFGAGGVDALIVSVDHPNVRGLGCDFSREGLWIGDGIYFNELPMSVQSYYRESPAVQISSACANLITPMQITSMGYADSLWWDFGDGMTAGYPSTEGKSVGHVYHTPGTYEVRVRKYIGGIYREIVSVVSVAGLPEVNLGSDTTLCAGQTLQLDGGPMGISFEWSTGADTRTIVVDSAGNYDVKVSDGICENTDQISISVNTYPEFTLGDDRVICDSDSVMLSVNTVDGYSYLWSTGEAVNEIVVTENGGYQLTVSNGWCKTIDGIHIQIAPVRNLALNETELTSAYGERIYLEAAGENIDSWTWIFGDRGETITTIPAVSYEYRKSGAYVGELTASNVYGCSDKVLFKVIVPDHLIIPNVFTPNDDGSNDTFEVQYNGREAFHLAIFNRWGEEIFSSQTPEVKWKGSDESPGTYYYLVKAGGKSYRGWVSLVR